MCSFLVTNKKIKNFDSLNYNLSRRGPDGTNIIEINNIIFLHNLLHITGERTNQPMVDNYKGLAMVYNGEIYNYIGKSDTEYVFNTIKNKGIQAFKEFDGEFSAVLLVDENIFLINDIFGTKPIFYSTENDFFGVCSYYSVLLDLGFKEIKKLRPNSIYNLTTGCHEEIYRFNLNQTEANFNEWEDSFLSSVDKRITDKSFISLSSGYDSGAIALAVKLLGKTVPYFCVPTKESHEILTLREKFLGKLNYITVNEQQFTKHYNKINNFTDNYVFSDYDFKKDRASIGLSVIFEKAKQDKLNVSISGSGADEIISDYGIEGRGVFFMDNKSVLKGIFPEDLSSVFPWANFFHGRQEQYLYKEESVAGYYGIETRYPFLDKKLVQSFLNLKCSLKNQEYKSPLAYFFKKHNFPYEQKIKRGFNL